MYLLLFTNQPVQSCKRDEEQFSKPVKAHLAVLDELLPVLKIVPHPLLPTSPIVFARYDTR